MRLASTLAKQKPGDGEGVDHLNNITYVKAAHFDALDTRRLQDQEYQQAQPLPPPREVHCHNQDRAIDRIAHHTPKLVIDRIPIHQASFRERYTPSF
jgi:hypothetical protein